MQIPFHRACLGQEEKDEVQRTLDSGWLTTGPKTKQFEAEFAAFVGAKHAIALNSATAALHLALDAIGLQRGEAVLVPTMTFAATAEVVRYFDAEPILVDCNEDDFNINIADAQKRAAFALARGAKLKAIIPVHYGGQIVDMQGVTALARQYNLSIVEDAAHCCPAAYREFEAAPWKYTGSESQVACYSFYANKCITTGEGGMACTNDDRIADRMRIMALHGISKDAWKRFTAQGSWYYEITAPGYKYNLTDIASSIGIHQLRKADVFRTDREKIAERYCGLLGHRTDLTLPYAKPNRIHSWHLYPVVLKLEMLNTDRASIMDELKAAGIGASVHWIPLHMHPYYRNRYAYKPEDYPTAAKISQANVSLPLYPGMTEEETGYVASVLGKILEKYKK